MAKALASVGSVSVESNETEAKTSEEENTEILQEQEKAHQLPEPQGYKVLITIPEPDKTSEGGILKAQETIEKEEVGSMVGFVIKLGQDAYKDEKRFPNGPYCKEGDFIIMRSYSGTRIKVHGKEFRLINDDSVEAVVQDPRGVMKA
jgi:co-chaperonin GroES (HSP10)